MDLNHFLTQWGSASATSVGFFWMALWAFVLGYGLSSAIQIFISEKRMRETMGGNNGRSIALGAFFGFISSSCSFSALATTKSLFQKGAGFAASMAFLLASTNLVIELGIVISIFLSWQFIVAEYVGGILLILIVWAAINVVKPRKLIQQARENLADPTSRDTEDAVPFQEKVRSFENWAKVGKQFGMEWKMVWKDVTIGFTIAGIISAFVPDSFFETLFLNTGTGNTEFSFGTLLQHSLVGPVAAFLTFIGSMGNIPLAALLYGKGVSFAGLMAFIFSDLVVFPVLRINARYYGWRMSLFILLLLFTALLVASLLLHYSFDWLDLLPPPAETNFAEANHFQVDYTFFLNISFLLVSAGLIYLGFFKGKAVHHHKEMAPKSPRLEQILKYLALTSYVWLAIGLVLNYLIL